MNTIGGGTDKQKKKLDRFPIRTPLLSGELTLPIRERSLCFVKRDQN